METSLSETVVVLFNQVYFTTESSLQSRCFSCLVPLDVVSWSGLHEDGLVAFDLILPSHSTPFECTALGRPVQDP